MFYRMGWSGINIDAKPGGMGLFQKMRPRDINLEMGVANQEGSLNYFVFNEPALNGFSAELSEERSLAVNPYQIKEVIKVDIKPLNEILDRHFLGVEILIFLVWMLKGLISKFSNPTIGLNIVPKLFLRRY